MPRESRHPEAQHRGAAALAHRQLQQQQRREPQDGTPGARSRKHSGETPADLDARGGVLNACVFAGADPRVQGITYVIDVTDGKIEIAPDEVIC